MVLHAPVRICRQNGTKMILVDRERPERRRQQRDAAQMLAEAVSKTHHGQELRQTLGVDCRHAGRVLPLTFLAPDTGHGILQGNQLERISLAKLRKQLPVSARHRRPKCQN